MKGESKKEGQIDVAADIQLIDRFEGCLLGAALGDAVGAPYEGGLLGGLAWAVVGFGKGDLLRWTDDTQMGMGLAESLVECRGLDADHLARRWADRMQLTRGYGPGTSKLLRRIKAGEDWRVANKSVFPDGSFGNGAAMRAAPIGLFYHRDAEQLRRAAETSSSITHAHPLGIEGGLLIARAVSLALDEALPADEFLDTLHSVCSSDEYRGRLVLVKNSLDGDPDPAWARRNLGCTIRAHESAVTAVYAFCHFRDHFKRLMEFIIKMGGDTDTIGAMAGGLLGAHQGRSALPPELLGRLETRDSIASLARALHDCPDRP
ncbi:MAG: ADP-ribosylglycohydrolase family protein [Planctomycetota bacterium]|nr:ADP-ribosylglycohydrolase family protein [Planctomycetota bacterium]